MRDDIVDDDDWFPKMFLYTSCHHGAASYLHKKIRHLLFCSLSRRRFCRCWCLRLVRLHPIRNPPAPRNVCGSQSASPEHAFHRCLGAGRTSPKVALAYSIDTLPAFSAHYLCPSTATTFFGVKGRASVRRATTGGSMKKKLWLH